MYFLLNVEIGFGIYHSIVQILLGCFAFPSFRLLLPTGQNQRDGYYFSFFSFRKLHFLLFIYNFTFLVSFTRGESFSFNLTRIVRSLSDSTNLYCTNSWCYKKRLLVERTTSSRGNRKTDSRRDKDI